LRREQRPLDQRRAVAPLDDGGDGLVDVSLKQFLVGYEVKLKVLVDDTRALWISQALE
jgi:hypothetical protein